MDELREEVEKWKNDLKNKKGQNTYITNIMYIEPSGNILADALGSKNVNTDIPVEG